MGKKKARVSVPCPSLFIINSKGTKKSLRTAGPSATTTKPSEPETTGTYGVVPCEYNIQAQINWLTAPPSSIDKKNSSNNATQPGPSKKPQRGFHKDVCEGCGEGECLMYCDKCPVAFHAICDDPPLPPEDFEAIGLAWKCKKCRNNVTVKSEDIEDGADSSSSTNGGPISQFFHQTLAQSSTQNPSQFKLPKEMPAYDYPFPGTSRHLLKKCRPRTAVCEVENGIVPRPVALCYHCHKSCRIGPIIQCDKCDLFFHLDCVDPPLTTIPTSVWICPLHVEPYLESTQLTSVALSERVKIWENGDKPVNRSAVIYDFLRKTSRRNPMFRKKQPIQMISNHDNVPEMVRNSYRADIVNLNERFGGLHLLATVSEMEAYDRMMTERLEDHRKCCNEKYLPAGLSLANQKEKLEMLRKKNEFKIDLLIQMMELCNSDVPKTQCQPNDGTIVEKEAEVSKDGDVNKSWIQQELKTMFRDLKSDERNINELKEELKEVNKLYSVADHVSNKTAPKDQPPQEGVSAVPPEGQTTSGRDCSTALDTVTVRCLPKKTVRKLAACHLRYLRRKKEIRERTKLKNKDRYLACLKPLPTCILTLFVENVGVTVEMTSLSFWIGSSSSCDWKITDLVKCNRIQKKHAKMFFNPVENCWEILNYSPNGLYVNNTWFGFKGAGAPLTNANSERYQEIQERNIRRLDEYIDGGHGNLQEKDLSLCYCKPFPVQAMSTVFEGSAKVQIGNKVQIGCAKIVVQGFLY